MSKKNGVNRGYRDLMKYVDGSIYKGEVDANDPDKREGQGELRFSNNDVYRGRWENDNIQGYGIYYFASERIEYRGNFKKNKMHGQGSLFRVGSGQEEIYRGEWEAGQKQGQGKYYYARDSYYEGGWSRNTKDGKGVFVNSQGRYEGEWKGNKRNGKGVLELKNGILYNGIWKNDEFTNGKVTYTNGDVYNGEMLDWKRHGYGTYQYANNNGVYKGYWNTNKKDGQGQMIFKNGDSFSGEFRNDEMMGHECMYRWKSEGIEMVADFKRGLPTKGVLTEPRGQPISFQIPQ